MTLKDALTLLAAMAVVLLPGAGMIFALRVRRWLVYAGLAPAASIGVAMAVGMICAITGLRFGIVTLAVATVLLFAVGFFGWWRSRGGETEPVTRVPLWSRVAWVGGVVLVATGIVVGLRTWMSGMGTLSSLPQEHDTILHSELVAYILNTGRGAPWQLMPADFLDNGPVAIYPAGMHLLSAATGEITGGAVRGLNGVTVILLALCTAMSAAALAYVVGRRARLAEPLALCAGGLAGLIAVGMNNPTITFTSMGGVLPNAASLVLVPGVLAVLVELKRRDWGTGISIGVAGAGLIALHPSAGASVGVSLLVWWAVEAFTRDGRRRIGHALAPLGIGGVVALLIGLPLVLGFFGVSGRTAAFPPDVRPMPFANALGDAVGLPYSGYLPVYDGNSQVTALVLAVVGMAALLMRRRGLGLVAVTAAWVVLTVAMWVSPGKGFEAPVTGFFYHSLLRVRAHFSLLVPVLGGVGVVLVAVAIAVVLRRYAPLRRTPVAAGWLAAALVAVLAVGYAAVPARDYMKVSAHYLQTRYGKPDLIRIGQGDLAAIDFLADKVKPGERVLNSANDGSTYLYVLKGIPTVNTLAFGYGTVPCTYRLLQRFNQYPTDPEMRKCLVERNVTWVYVDQDPPPIGASSSPEDWASSPDGLFRAAKGLSNLTGLPGLTEQFSSGGVHVYKLDLDAVRKLG